MNAGNRSVLPIAERNAMAGIVLLTGLSVALTVGAVAASGLKFANAADFFVRFGGILGFLFLINVYQYVRMPENKRVIIFINMMIVYLIMSITMMSYQYCMATFKAYPITEVIEITDKYIGFNWLQFVTFVNNIPYLSDIIGTCYKNWMREFIVVFVVLSIYAKFEDLHELTMNYIVAGMCTLTVSGFLDSKSLDAVAAYAIKGLHHPSGVSPVYLDKLEHLRQGVDSVLDFNIIIGLVAFPSFHAGAAVLLATATRNLKWLWFPFLCFNVLVLVGTITEGGHNFTDVIGGCLFSVGAIAIAQGIRNSRLASRALEAASRVAPWSAVGSAEAPRSA